MFNSSTHTHRSTRLHDLSLPVLKLRCDMPSVLPCCVFRFHGGIVTKQRAAESCCLRSRAHPSSVLSRQQLRTRARHSTCSDTHCSAEESTAASRRSLLAGAFLLPLSVGAACAAEVDALPAASTDIIEGTQRWADLGFQALGVQLQQVANGDAPDDVPDLQERRRRFGECGVCRAMPDWQTPSLCLCVYCAAASCNTK